MKMLMRSALLAASILTPTALCAQTVSDTEDSVSVGEDEPTIIVTARKKEEDLQEVPATVAVVTSETITELALDSFEEIANITPGLFFDESFGRNGNRPVIRGQANILGDSGVAFFIDGIYYTGSLADYDVDTIERFEVVKGPQSALYGRNTYSGAINIVSKRPGDEWEGRLAVDVAENDRYEVTAGIRGPLGNGFGLGLNARFYDFGGEFTNQFDGEKVGQQQSISASGVLSFDDGGPLTALLRGYYNRTDDGQGAIFIQPADENNCFFDNGALYDGAGRYFCGVIEPREINTDFSRQFINPNDVGLEADTYNVSLRLDYELTDSLTLTSLSGFNSRTETQKTDGDYSPESFQTVVFARFPAGAPIGFGPAGPIFPFGYVGGVFDFSFANRSETVDFSQELRLSYESDAFDFLVGGYYFDQSADSFSVRELPSDAAARAGANFGAALADEQARCAANPICGSVAPFFGPTITVPRGENFGTIENIAIFGAATFRLTDTVSLSVEGRYAEETIDIETFAFDLGDERPDPVGDSAKFTAFTPRVTLDWQVTPDNLIYVIYAEGLKPGGFNGIEAISAQIADPTLDIATFDEEENKSIELGIKNSFLDGSVIFNLAAYYTEIDGYQLTENILLPANQVSFTTNSGDAEIVGVEAELVGRIDDVVVTVNYAFADAEFTRGFDENQGVLNDVADDGLVNCSTGDQFPDDDECDSAFGSIAGQRIPRAPQHRIFADLSYSTPTQIGVNDDWEFFAGANLTYTSSAFAQVHNEAETGDSIEVDARLGIQNDNFRLQFYVDNLTDEDAVQQVLRFADVNANLRRAFIAGRRPGRRFGALFVSSF
ncbi:MAG: TonB-dependent receptor [Pseudomonadota bacterium]